MERCAETARSESKLVPASHLFPANGLCSDKTADFVKSDEGQRMQKRVWNQLVAKLEAIDPECVRNAL